MLLAVALLTLVTCAGANGNVIGCPDGCNCQVRSSDTQLHIDCRHVKIDGEQLSDKLDIMLSTDQFVDHVTSLSIIYTPLTRVPASVCKLLNLNSLNLALNNITRLPDNCFTKLAKLVTLSMNHNSIVGLQDGLFHGLQSLVTLDLSYNHITFIGLLVFSNSSDLTSLRSLDLSYNKLTSLEPWPYYLLIHGGPDRSSYVTVNLRYNLISNFTNKLKFKCRSGMKLPWGFVQLDDNRIVHIMDVYNGWNVDRKQCLRGRRERFFDLLKFPPGDFRVIVGSALNNFGTYVCDCTDFPIYKVVAFMPHYEILSNVWCSDAKFQTAGGLVRLAVTIPLDEFVCELSDRCPPRCRCVYRPANATLHVYCSAANLSSLPVELPPLPKSYDRYKLDFSNNKLLRRLEHRPYFINTSIVDVSQCAIDDVDINAWRELAKMQRVFVTPHVNLQNNKIKSLPLEVAGINFTSVLLTLNHNPLECSCENRWVIDWLKSLSASASVGDAGNVMCGSPSRLEGRSVVQSTEYDFCVDPSIRMLKIALSSTLAPVAVLLIFGFSVYRLRVRLFTRWKFHPFDRDECVGEDMDYDVFLCCSSKDHNPHGLRILEEMESEGYKVCYHERDFLPGQLITDNMAHGVELSKRTVCLISNNFLESNFCMTEFDVAYHHNVTLKRKKRLIVLMMLDRPIDLYANDASDTATLRQFLRQYTYIDYTADDWFDKLLYALPLRGLRQDNQDRNGDDDRLIRNIQ